MNVAEIARKTLEILDRDGWCKFHLTAQDYSMFGVMPVRFSGVITGSHCLGGAWNLALTGEDSWVDEDLLEPLANMIKAQYPRHVREIVPDDYDDVLCQEDDLAWFIADWNNAPSRTEADVRSVLEKLAVAG